MVIAVPGWAAACIKVCRMGSVWQGGGINKAGAGTQPALIMNGMRGDVG